MSEPSSKHPEGGHFHAVRFYEDDDALCRIVATFVVEGLAAGEPAIIVATPEHRDAIRRAIGELSPPGQDLGPPSGLTFLDAEATLAKITVDGIPQRACFDAVLVAALYAACGGRAGCRVRVYGEMVDLLWQEGRQQEAIQLEMLWNRLAARADFALLCGYAMGTFYKTATLDSVRAQHTHIVADSGEPLALALA